MLNEGYRIEKEKEDGDIEFNKTTRGVLAFALLAVLLFAPLRVEIGYTGIYYTVLALMAIWGAFRLIGEKNIEERFFRNWERKKSRPKAGIILGESIKALISILAILAFGQIVVNGQDLRSLSENMPYGAGIGLLVMLIALAVLLGFVRFLEKNRRYDQLYSKFHGS